MIESKKKHTPSIVLTAFLIAILILGQTATSLLVKITGPSEATVNSTVKFTARIEIQGSQKEWAYIKSIKLKVEKEGGGSDTISIPINLTPNTVVLSDTDLTNTNSYIKSITVNPDTNAIFGYGYGYGYINGSNYGQFGYGYGYGYSTLSNAVIAYDIAWIPHNTGTYNFTITVTVVDRDSTEVQFSSQPHTIQIKSKPVGGGEETTAGGVSGVTPQPSVILKVSPEAIAKTITAGRSADASITLYNDGNADLNNVQISASGDIASWISFSKNNIPNIPPHESAYVIVKITVPSDTNEGTYTGAIEVIYKGGKSKEIPVTITVKAPPVQIPEISGAEVVYSESAIVQAGKPLRIILPWKKQQSVGIVSIVASLPENITRAEVLVSRLTKLPKVIPKPHVRDSYIYFDITFTEPETGKTIEPTGEIEFKVPKSWLEERGYKPEYIILMKYDNEWKELPTELTYENYTYFYYKAKTKRFSIFTIAVKFAEVTPTPTETPSGVETPTPTPKKPEETPQTPAKVTPAPSATPGEGIVKVIKYIVAVLIILGIIIAIAYLIKTKGTRLKVKEKVVAKKAEKKAPKKPKTRESKWKEPV